MDKSIPDMHVSLQLLCNIIANLLHIQERAQRINMQSPYLNDVLLLHILLTSFSVSEPKSAKFESFQSYFLAFTKPETVALQLLHYNLGIREAEGNVSNEQETLWLTTITVNSKYICFFYNAIHNLTFAGSILHAILLSK